MKTARTTTTARTGLALLGLVAALLLGAAPVGAHGGEGRSEITSITRSGGDVTVVARITYVEDGHGVPDATVTVVVDDGTPVPMEPGAEEGEYQATVPAPEGAAIRVTSVEPATSAEATAPAAADETTTTSATAGETTTTAAETLATDPSSPADDDAPLDDDEVPEPNALDEAPEGGRGNLIVIAVIAVVVVAALVAAFVLRRKPPAGDEPTP